MGTDGTTVAAMAAHETAIKAKQSAERSTNRPAKAKSAIRSNVASSGKPADDSRIAVLVAWRASADAPAPVLDVVDAAIRRGTGAPRSTSAKADPAEIAAYFSSTGFSRKELAAIVGVSTSVIGTVANISGDRWSAERWSRARILIDAAVNVASSKSK